MPLQEIDCHVNSILSKLKQLFAKKNLQKSTCFDAYIWKITLNLNFSFSSLRMGDRCALKGNWLSCQSHNTSFQQLYSSTIYLQKILKKTKQISRFLKSRGKWLHLINKNPSCKLMQWFANKWSKKASYFEFLHTKVGLLWTGKLSFLESR